MSNKSGGVRLQCAEATAAGWGCGFLYGSGLGLLLPLPLRATTSTCGSLVGHKVGVGFPASSSGAASSGNPRDPLRKYVSPEAVETSLPVPGDGVGLRGKGKKKAVRIKIKV
ncbi:hypothetical protein TRIUR3_16163 [Triticum urartu]|uniref:Uncharacterized protein n=1 Tax=Triticum urartu TaxID=4572 RepID=M7ZFC2_TRIUA|nr:hypothetical protein TRIUR3_16163 [Triticum urartu]